MSKKYTATQAFFLHGEVVSPGDSVELSNADYANCHSRVIEHRVVKVKEVKTAKPRKVTTRKVKDAE